MDTLWIIGLFFVISIDFTGSVKIQKLSVPSVIVMDHGMTSNENTKQYNLSAPEFLLDCEYDVDENENGLVIKWLLNNKIVYQWIPPRPPIALTQFKNRIKNNFTVSDDPLKKYRAVAVIRPMLNFSGEYACSVQTFQSSDRKSSHLQIIVPESHFKLNYRTDTGGTVHIKCSAFNVFPEPKLSLNINNVELSSEIKVVNDKRDGLFDVKILSRIPQTALKSETIINCQLVIPNTNYTKKRETVYYEQKPSPSDNDDDEEDDLVLSLETSHLSNQFTKDAIASSSKPFTIIFFECYIILFCTIFTIKIC